MTLTIFLTCFSRLLMFRVSKLETSDIKTNNFADVKQIATQICSRNRSSGVNERQPT